MPGIALGFFFILEIASPFIALSSQFNSIISEDYTISSTIIYISSEDKHILSEVMALSSEIKVINSHFDFL